MVITTERDFGKAFCGITAMPDDGAAPGTWAKIISARL
jgi:hypothetical protein